MVEIPSTFLPRHMSYARTAELVAALYRDEQDLMEIRKKLSEFFIRKWVEIQRDEEPEKIKEKIWKALGLMLVYTKEGKSVSPMALPIGSTVRDFAERIHKDFIKNFRYAMVERGKKLIRAGMDYELKDGDVVEIKIALK